MFVLLTVDYSLNHFKVNMVVLTFNKHLKGSQSKLYHTISSFSKYFFFSSFNFQFSSHDVVVLKPNKADLGSPALGQGVVYRLKVILCWEACIFCHDNFNF